MCVCVSNRLPIFHGALCLSGKLSVSFLSLWLVPLLYSVCVFCLLAVQQLCCTCRGSTAAEPGHPFVDAQIWRDVLFGKLELVDAK